MISIKQLLIARIRLSHVLVLLVLLFVAGLVSADNPPIFEGDCGSVSITPIDQSQVHVICYEALASTATPAPTDTPTATAEPTAEPTATNTPLPPPTPTITPTSNIEPYPSAPLCPDSGANHPTQQFHTLWDYTRGCHYDHTHGDNPHSVDDIFGTAVFDMMGGEISYPWHTPGENEEIKHKSYQWVVERGLPCFSQFADGCITDYRAFVHNDLHNVFSTHHSALVEAIVCRESNPTDCGYFLVSGHQATGDLIIDGTVVLDRLEPSGAPRPVMLHYDTIGNANFATWYPVFSSWMRVSTEIGDMWGYYPIPNVPLPTTPDNLQFVRLAGNASRVQPHVIGLGFSRRNLLSIGADPTATNINYNGFLDVHTSIPGDCTGISEMCAPLILNNVPNVQYQHRGDYRPDFDICFDTTGNIQECNNSGSNSSGWLVFPGFAQ